MIRTKLGLFGLCAAVLGLMATSAGTAQGATLSWLILNGSKTTATELKVWLFGEKDSESYTLLTKLLKLKISVTCSNFEPSGIFLETGGKLTTGSRVKFTGCGASLGCSVKSAGQPLGTVLTNPLKGGLVLHTLAGGGTEVLASLAPEVGTTLVVLLFEGAECLLPEENPISGSVFLKDCLKQATTHAFKHLVELGPLTSLYVGSDTAEHLETSVDGSGWIRLNFPHASLDWAAMDA